MRYNILYIIILIVLVNSKLYGQNMICGYVCDKENNPIYGVSIQEEKTVNGAITDSLGFFEFEYYNEKSEFKVAHIGFKLTNFKIHNVCDTVRIHLEPDLHITDGGCWTLPKRYFGFRYSYEFDIPYGLELVYSTYPLNIFVQGNYDFIEDYSYNVKIDKTILNHDNCSIINLIYENKFKKEFERAQKLNNHCISIERKRTKWKYGLGLGYSDLELKNYSNRTFGGLVSFKYPFYKLNSTIELKTYYWIDYVQYDISLDVIVIRNLDLSVEYINIKNIHDFIIKIGYRLTK